MPDITAKKVEAEIVESMPLDERMIRAFEKIAEKTFLQIQKRDYRATMVHREEKGEIPDSAAALIHIDETSRDELNNPIEYDVKGHINEYEAIIFKDTNFALALSQLKNWSYFEEIDCDSMGNPKKDEKGNIIKVRIPVNLAQIDMLSKKRLNLSINGRQGYKHIDERRANAGMPPDDSLANKITGFMGFRKEKVSREELEAQYGSSAGGKK